MNKSHEILLFVHLYYVWSNLNSSNQDEIKLVMDYVAELLQKLKINGKHLAPTDIGIVSPYSQQCHEIRERINALGFDEITVGSAEVYQGQERPVIIISTVRTGNEIGFVNDAKVYPTLDPIYYEHDKLFNELNFPFVEIQCYDDPATKPLDHCRRP